MPVERHMTRPPPTQHETPPAAPRRCGFKLLAPKGSGRTFGLRLRRQRRMRIDGVADDRRCVPRGWRRRASLARRGPAIKPDMSRRRPCFRLPHFGTARWTRGQLFQGVTGSGPWPPLRHAPVTCMSRPGALFPRSQGNALRRTFQASAPFAQARTVRVPLRRKVQAVSHGVRGAGKSFWSDWCMLS
jgi:hypothetical protein